VPGPARDPPRDGTPVLQVAIAEPTAQFPLFVAGDEYAPSARTSPVRGRFSDTVQRRNVTSLAVGDAPLREVRDG
jgi:hypothetical protein